MEVKSLTLPGFTLQFSQGEKRYMRPDSTPRLLANTQALYGLAASLTFAVLIAAYLSYLYGCFPNRLRRTLFKQALRKLAGLSKTDMAQALTIVHHALNSLNGQPLFYTQLSDFYRCNPQYLQVSSQLTGFFNFSNRYFFSAGMIVVAQDLQQLKDLCERCRKIERGSQ